MFLKHLSKHRFVQFSVVSLVVYHLRARLGIVDKYLGQLEESGSINGDKITLQKGVLRAVGAKIFQFESQNYILVADLKDFTIEV